MGALCSIFSPGGGTLSHVDRPILVDRIPFSRPAAVGRGGACTPQPLKNQHSCPTVPKMLFIGGLTTFDIVYNMGKCIQFRTDVAWRG